MECPVHDVAVRVTVSHRGDHVSLQALPSFRASFVEVRLVTLVEYVNNVELFNHERVRSSVNTSVY